MAKKAVWGVVAGGVAAAALATTMVFTVPAAAETGGQAVAAGHLVGSSTEQAGAAAAAPDKTARCDRLKKQQQKRQAVETRLSADANTRGSIAWLTAKASAASTAGNTTLAQLYTDKAALRTQLLGPLKTVEADLAAVIQANCS